MLHRGGSTGLNRWMGGVLVGSTAALLLLSSLQCIETPLAPVPPASVVELSIPLANRFRTGEDLVKKGGALRIGSDGGFVFEANQTFSPIPLPDITVSPQPTAEQVSVGTFTVDSLPSTSVVVAPLPQGTPYPSGTSSVPVSEQNLATFPAFDFIYVTQGTLSLRVTNNYPFSISFPDTIFLKNNFGSDNSVVAAFKFTQTLARGQSETATSNLAGRLMRSAMRIGSFTITVSASSPGVVGANENITFAFSSTRLTSDSALAIIPSQNVFSVANAQLQIDDSVAIQDGRFRSGLLTAVFTNNLDITVGIALQFDNFRNVTTNAPFQIVDSIAARGSLSVPINASLLRIVNTSAAPLGTTLTYSVGIRTINSGGVKKTVRSSDYVRAELQVGTQPFIVQSVTGRIKPTFVPITTGASGLYELGEAQKKLQGQFKFDSVRVAMKLPITGSFVTDYDLWLVAENRKVTPVVKDSIRMPINSTTGARRIVPTIGAPPPVIVLDKSTNFDEFLGRFFPNLPDTFMIRGYVLLNPQDVFPTSQGVQSIWDTTKIYPSVNLTFPSRLGISNGILTDTIDLGNESKFPKAFVNSLERGTMFLEITNGLGFQLDVHAYLIQRRGGVVDTILTIAPSGRIEAGQIDASGNVIQPRVSSPSVSLTGTELAKFDVANTLGLRLDLATTGGGTTPIKIRSSDFIRIKASLNVKYMVNKPE